jgi:hypothetical protein
MQTGASLAWEPARLNNRRPSAEVPSSLQQTLLNDSLLETAKKNHGGQIAAGTKLPPVKAVITTPLPMQLPQGSLTVPSLHR